MSSSEDGNPGEFDIPQRASWFRPSQREVSDDEEFLDDPPASDSLDLRYSTSVAGSEEEELSQSLLEGQSVTPESAGGSAQEVTATRRRDAVPSPIASGSSSRPITSFFGRSSTASRTPSSRGTQEQGNSSQSSVASSSASARSSQSGGSSRQSQQQEMEEDPFPFLAPLWKYVGPGPKPPPAKPGETPGLQAYRYLCPEPLCKKEIKVNRSSKSNMKTHLERMHPRGPWLERHADVIKAGRRTPRPSGSGAGASEPQRPAELSQKEKAERAAATFFLPRDRVATQEELNKLVRIYFFQLNIRSEF